jgi:glycosyltransferase involved in cell wall biosynthesis
VAYPEHELDDRDEFLAALLARMDALEDSAPGAGGEGPFDVVHMQGVIRTGELVARWCRKRAKPWVATAHENFLFGSEAAEAAERTTQGLRGAVAGAALLTTVSEAQAAALRALPADPPFEVEVIPNWVAPDSLPLKPLRREDCGTQEPFRFVTVGRLQRHRGGMVLIRAMAERALAHCHLVVIGDGVMRGPLREQARELGVADRVEFLGEVPQATVSEQLRRCDAFVLPSYWESFSVPLLEALMTGLPAVATDCGGPADLVKAMNGLLVPPGDPIQLARAMAAVADGVVVSTPAQIRKDAITRFGEKAIVPRWLDVYQRARNSAT